MKDLTAPERDFLGSGTT